ncbi:50S ribosomal protein L1 [Fonticula alba]|uniref:50S ribosomal protein L1 n=1 Tax=Fonticula alba TaxID=691883 RepID=A0A058Z6N8_FONAL|nr:50S ribosomal protein L1 [Fonticula alba]KCV69197.1 50S ribosomal protein L1 [Fonticula alba]|eukprot:XP_009496768.1 50S ribosomal protein L1 [Fonticula alba]
MEHFDREQARKSVRALIAYTEKQAEASSAVPVETDKKGKKGKATAEAVPAIKPLPTNNLIDDSLPIQLIVSVKNIPARADNRPMTIPLKHSIYKKAEVCLITKDPRQEYKDLLVTEKVKGITRVMDVSQINKEFRPYEAKRNLAAAYDLFLVDLRVIRMMPKALGSPFYSKKKQPIPISLTTEDLAARVEELLSCTYMYHGQGASSSVVVASTKMSENQIYENVVHAILAVAGQIPRGWANIQSIHVKTTHSVSIPIFVAKPDLVRKIGN